MRGSAACGARAKAWAVSFVELRHSLHRCCHSYSVPRGSNAASTAPRRLGGASAGMLGAWCVCGVNARLGSLWRACQGVGRVIGGAEALAAPLLVQRAISAPRGSSAVSTVSRRLLPFARTSLQDFSYSRTSIGGNRGMVPTNFTSLMSDAYLRSPRHLNYTTLNSVRYVIES